ncbi:hypothetical protein Q4595_26340, partial [Wenyingzhuangia sp. 1_MG-2023]|nr:hypothetical protein [Wenyingzhuangia sp. 1_MG-2023]
GPSQPFTISNTGTGSELETRSTEEYTESATAKQGPSNSPVVVKTETATGTNEVTRMKEPNPIRGRRGKAAHWNKPRLI